ncbi:MAG: gamma-glutamyl-gamma-aminobutyrate hydrolase family protein [Deltaproteobacteria bacterium]|nr:gamma-glutamyl-gamma-aminobutyrate hydrolase family protein [Deltaproteobacteria bacterium]
MRDEKRDAVIIQHVAHEGPGILGDFLERNGFIVRRVRVYRGEAVPRDVAENSILIVLGGPMGAYEDDKYPFLKDELRLIGSALKSGVPTLGVCLGSQLMARAAGARVYPGGKKEIGWYTLRLTAEGARDRLFLGLPSEFMVFQWHGDTFDLPPGAALLASSDIYPNQLFRVGKRAYAFQFHLEVTEKMIGEWLTVNDDEIKGLKGAVNPAAVKKETGAGIGTLQRYGGSVFSRFLRL